MYKNASSDCGTDVGHDISLEHGRDDVERVALDHHIADAANKVGAVGCLAASQSVNKGRRWNIISFNRPFPLLKQSS